MKNKQILYMAVAFAVLLVVYLLMQRGSMPVAETNYLVEVDTSNVEEVSIYNDGATITLARTNGAWKLTNPIEYPANGRFANMMLEKLADLRIESEIASSKDAWKSYEVDNDKAIRVTVKQNGQEATFYIGKTSENYRQSYARLEGKDATFLIKGTYATALKRNTENWRDKSIVTFKQQDIVAYKTNDVTVEKKTDADGWNLISLGKDVSGDWHKCTQVAAAISRLQTSKFPEESEYAKTNWKRAVNSVEVTTTNGETTTLRFFKDKAKDNRYFVKRNDEPTVFVIFEGVYKQIFKTNDDLKVEPKEDKEATK